MHDLKWDTLYTHPGRISRRTRTLETNKHRYTECVLYAEVDRSDKGRGCVTRECGHMQYHSHGQGTDCRKMINDFVYCWLNHTITLAWANRPLYQYRSTQISVITLQRYKPIVNVAFVFGCHWILILILIFLIYLPWITSQLIQWIRTEYADPEIPGSGYLYTYARSYT